MRRLTASTSAHDLRVTFKLLHILILLVVSALLFVALGARARAQIQELSCPEGLMKKADAGTGTLLLKTAMPGCYLGAPRVAADFSVDISGPIARTKVTQRFENPADGWVEGVYLFPLPETAAVDTLKMKIGDRFIEGEIKERKTARQIYEAAKAEGKRASLVEQERPNVFTNQVANIGPHETIVVQIEYQESLRYDAARYHLRVPLVVAPRYNPAPSATLVQFREGSQLNVFDPVPHRDRITAPVLHPDLGKVNPVSLEVKLEAGFPLGAIVSESHAISVVRNGDTGATIALTNGEVPTDRDFVLSFAPVPGREPVVSLLKEERTDSSNYFLALIVPRVLDTDVATRPREVVFVLDNSGSMGGESIRQAKASLILALDRLKSGDRFNVIRFDHTMTKLFRNSVNATAENLAYAKGFVSNIEASGGTVMLPALLAALDDPTPSDRTRLRQVIFLTDGEVGNEAQLFSAIDEKLGRSRLFTVGIGSAPNSYFMAGAARAGRGAYTYISSTDQVASRMGELFAKLERPAMTDIAARWPDGMNGEAWPNPLPDLYAGEPVVVTVKADRSDGTLVLSGKIAGTAWSATLNLAEAHAARGIEKLWARNKIAAFDESRVQGADPARIDAAVLDVALQHHLVSRLTSLVAVEVTPHRPIGAELSSLQVPLNLPAGWDFEKVFGERIPVREQRADLTVPAVLLTQLALSNAPPVAIEPKDAGLVLPQGATDSRLILIIGFMCLALAGLLIRLQRGAHLKARVGE
jgi:Ca-activated chloride channel homolog